MSNERRVADRDEATGPTLTSTLNRLRAEDASVAEFVEAGGLSAFRPLSGSVRSTTDEMLAARFDPEPWEDEAGCRFAANPDPSGAGYLRYRPRPEFIPSRDPEPWVSWGVRYATQQNAGCYFDPRPEYARPEPNPILVAFRHVPVEFRSDFIEGVLGEDNDWRHFPDARKVLTRLVGVFA